MTVTTRLPIATCTLAAQMLLGPLLSFIPTAAGSRAAASDAAVVHFDAPAIVIAEPINPAVVELPTMGGDLLRLRIPVSTFQASEFRGQVAEYVIEIESPYQSLRILDFWPKQEVYSDIDGTVSVESTQDQDRNLNFSLSGAYEPFGRGAVEGDFHQQSKIQQRYQRKPSMQVLTSSGTIRRGYGVFFKFRPGPLPMLEGVRDLAILAEVPPGWRADMLQINMRAVGSLSPHASRPQSLGESRLWMTTHREGDRAAAAAATRYVTQERALRSLAARKQAQVHDKFLPTFWHKLGASLEVIEPKIPGDYLAQVIFSMSNQYYDNAATNRLPVDLRVAVLDYWEIRNALVSLAGGRSSDLRASHISFND